MKNFSITTYTVIIMNLLMWYFTSSLSFANPCMPIVLELVNIEESKTEFFTEKEKIVLDNLSSVENSNSIFYFFDVGNIVHSVLMNQRPNWMLAKLKRVNATNLSKLILADCRFKSLIKKHLRIVTETLDDINHLGHENVLQEFRSWDYINVKRTQQFKYSKMILGLFSKASDIIDFLKPESKGDLENLIALNKKLDQDFEDKLGKFEEINIHENEPGYVYNPYCEVYFLNIQSGKDRFIQDHTDMKLMTKASVGYHDTTLHDYIEKLVNLRQS